VLQASSSEFNELPDAAIHSMQHGRDTWSSISVLKKESLPTVTGSLTEDCSKLAFAPCSPVPVAV
jgi:hypothetical protein